MMSYSDVILKYGTPTYVYDIDILIDRINYLKTKLPNYQIAYAVKANTFIPKYIENYVLRYEICSPGEFDICNKLQIDYKKMVISGVYKDQESIENMIMNYPDILRYTIESISQFNLLNNLSLKYKRNIEVLIRLTSGNQFGVNEEEVKEIIKMQNNKYLKVVGIEYFSGTQKHSLVRIEKEIDYLIQFVSSLESEFNINIKEIEYGPGLPVFYYQDDEFNEEEFLNKVNDILSKIKNKKVILEIGRSIASSCGSYLTSVVDIKRNKYGNFVILDGGINHLVYYGQTMAMKIPHYEIIPKSISEEEVYNLCGSLCTINDFLVKNIRTRKLDIDDVFVFKNVGAYSSTEGISLFLSRDLPKVVIYKDNKLMLVRENVKTSIVNFPNEVKE